MRQRDSWMSRNVNGVYGVVLMVVGALVLGLLFCGCTLEKSVSPLGPSAIQPDPMPAPVPTPEAPIYFPHDLPPSRHL